MEEETIKVTFTTQVGKKVKLDIDPTSTIKDVKAEFQEKTSIPMQLKMFMYKGIARDVGSMLFTELGYTPNTDITIVQNAGGGAF